MINCTFTKPRLFPFDGPVYAFVPGALEPSLNQTSATAANGYSTLSQLVLWGGDCLGSYQGPPQAAVTISIDAGSLRTRNAEISERPDD